MFFYERENGSCTPSEIEQDGKTKGSKRTWTNIHYFG